jgi:hypothetical protein
MCGPTVLAYSSMRSAALNASPGPVRLNVAEFAFEEAKEFGGEFKFATGKLRFARELEVLIAPALPCELPSADPNIERVG